MGRYVWVHVHCWTRSLFGLLRVLARALAPQGRSAKALFGVMFCFFLLKHVVHTSPVVHAWCIACRRRTFILASAIPRSTCRRCLRTIIVDRCSRLVFSSVGGKKKCVQAPMVRTPDWKPPDGDLSALIAVPNRGGNTMPVSIGKKGRTTSCISVGRSGSRRHT